MFLNNILKEYSGRKKNILTDKMNIWSDFDDYNFIINNKDDSYYSNYAKKYDEMNSLLFEGANKATVGNDASWGTVTIEVEGRPMVLKTSILNNIEDYCITINNKDFCYSNISKKYDDIKSVLFEKSTSYIESNNEFESEFASESDGLTLKRSEQSDRYNECKNKYYTILVNTMQNEQFEEGYISDSQRLYSLISSEFGANESCKLLHDIYKNNASNNKITKSILYLISEIQPKSLNGMDTAITAYALLNKDLELRDLALQCFEKWNDPSYLELIRSYKIGVPYLDEYLQGIIKHLETQQG